MCAIFIQEGLWVCVQSLYRRVCGCVCNLYIGFDEVQGTRTLSLFFFLFSLLHIYTLHITHTHTHTHTHIHIHFSCKHIHSLYHKFISLIMLSLVNHPTYATTLLHFLNLLILNFLTRLLTLHYNMLNRGSSYYIYQSVTSIYNYIIPRCIISEYKKLNPDNPYIQYIRTQNKHSQLVSICPSTPRTPIPLPLPPPTPTISEKISWFSR